MGHANLPYLEPLAVLGQNKLGTGPDFMPQDKSLAMQTYTFINTSYCVACMGGIMVSSPEPHTICQVR